MSRQTHPPLRPALLLLLILWGPGSGGSGSGGSGRAQAADAPFTVSLRVEQDRVAVAEPVSVTLTATAPRGWTIQLPKLPERFGELRVVEADAPLETAHTEGVTRSVRFEVESFLSGRYRIEPLPVRFRANRAADDPPDDLSDGAADEKNTAAMAAETAERQTPPLTIRVRTSLGLFDSGQLRDIHSEVNVPWTWWEWLAAGLVIVAIGTLGRVVYLGFHRWHEARPLSQRRLLRNLERLDQARLSREAANHEFIVSVADIVRQRLQIADDPRPIYRTTDEWIEHFASHPEWSEPIRLVLCEADRIKFAGGVATADQARRCMAAARRIVTGTLEESPPDVSGGVFR